MKTTNFRVLFLALYFLGLISSLSAQNEQVIDPKGAKSIRKVVKAWSVAHEKWDLQALENMYMDSLVFYTQMLSKSTAISKISGMFSPTDVFKHKLISDIDLKVLPNGTIKCNFTKEVTTKGKTKSYPSYLVLEKRGEKFLVCAEGDYITDKNLNFDYEESILSSFEYKSKHKASGKSNSWMYILIGLFLGATGVWLYSRRRTKVQQKGPVAEQKIETKPSSSTQQPTPVATDFEINLKKGHDFEGYVAGKFDKNYFKFKTWRSDKAVGEHIPESNKDPDLEFEFKCYDYYKKFAVECKYRSNNLADEYEICRPDQLDHYRKYERNNRIEVYIVLGLGGEALNPREIYLIPLKKLYSTSIHKRQLKAHYKATHSQFFYDRDIHRLT